MFFSVSSADTNFSTGYDTPGEGWCPHGHQNEYECVPLISVRAVGPFRSLPDPPLWLETLLPPWLTCGLSLLYKIPALSVTGKRAALHE